MYTLGPEEKASVVMAYTQAGLIRGELVTMQNTRVNSWFRTDSAPEHLHLHKVQSLQAVGGAIKSLAYPELLLPLPLIIGFHVAPPSQEPLDYDTQEDNRVPRPVTVIMGLFVMDCMVRISAQTDLATSLQISHSQWFSAYDAKITSPYMPQMTPIQVPMLLVRPTHVAFVLPG